MSKNRSIPKWVLGYAVFLFLLSWGAGITALIDPSLLFGGLDIDFAPFQGVMTMFGGRNIAFGVIAAIGLWRRDPKYLLMLFVGRFVVELVDLYASVTQGLTTLPAFGVIVGWLLFFLIPEGLGAYVLKTQIDSRN